MFPYRNISFHVVLAALLAFFSACASNAPEFAEIYSLKLILDEGAAVQSIKSSASSPDPSVWNVRCVSLGTDGVRTTSSSSYDSGIAGFIIEDIPKDQDTVCHIVDADGLLVSTMSIADASSLRGTRDVFRLRRNVEANLSYDVQRRSSTARGDDLLLGAVETRANLEGRWGVDCHDMRDIVTDDIVQGEPCPREVDGSQLYMHLVAATGAAGESRVAYGIWRSTGVFEACGSTEGLDALPEGWLLDDPVHATSFSWSAPFADLEPASATSGEIMRMIRANDAEEMLTYDDYVALDPDRCRNEDLCTIRYYDEMRNYTLDQAGSICWPELLFSSGDEEHTSALVWSFKGGKGRPVGRIDFIEAYQYGNETYMRNLASHDRTASANGTPVECNVREEYLVAVEIPDSDEDGRADDDADDAEIKARLLGDDDLISQGIQLEARYQARVDVASPTGRYDNLCRQDLGLEDKRSDDGLYADVILESLSAE